MGLTGVKWKITARVTAAEPGRTPSQSWLMSFVTSERFQRTSRLGAQLADSKPALNRRKRKAVNECSILLCPTLPPPDC
eukprot:7484329-Pyramimonas_sp.AAC.1